mgnify:FL=1
MIRHIVLWKLADFAEGNSRRDNAALIRQSLMTLPGVIPEIRSLEVHDNAGPDAGAFDLVLVSDFDDLAALERYQSHPAHKAVAAFVKAVRTDRAVVDYVVPEP